MNPRDPLAQNHDKAEMDLHLASSGGRKDRVLQGKVTGPSEC